MNTKTQHGFECENCGKQFTDGIDAGNHEIDTGHRVTNADVESNEPRRRLTSRGWVSE